jgi:hypothetical protein
MTEVATVAQMCLVASRWAKSGNGHPASTYQLVGGHEQTGQLGQCLDMILGGLGTLHDNCELLEERGGISMFRKLVIERLIDIRQPVFVIKHEFAQMAAAPWLMSPWKLSRLLQAPPCAR